MQAPSKLQHMITYSQSGGRDLTVGRETSRGRSCDEVI